MGKVNIGVVAGMLMAEFAQVGLMIMGKSAMSNGMSNLVFVFYSNLLASLILLPSSFLFHRSQRPPLTLPVLCGFFLLGLLGMEKLDWRNASSLAKSMGTIVLITGALIMTCYKGPPLLMTPSSHNPTPQLFSDKSNWVLGGLLLAIDCIFASAWLIVQALILKRFPAELIVVFFYCFFVAIQSAILCLAVERNSSAWSLKSNIRLIAVLYSAIFGSAFQVGISAWCLHQTGPLFVAMFKPLGIVFSVAVGIIFFGDTFHVGSFIGAAVIVSGFYLVMWAKTKEDSMGVESGVSSLESGSQNVPLLQDGIEESKPKTFPAERNQ